MEVHRVKLMAEYSIDYPLWQDGEGLMSQDAEDLHRELGLTDELLADVASWQAEWERAALGLTRRGFSERRHQKQGAALVQRLQAEAVPGYEFRLWRRSRRAAAVQRFRNVFVEPIWRLRHGSTSDE
jgi:hypothetical protein